MIDKVQRIREEVERLKLCTMNEHMKFYSEAAEAEYNALCKVEKIIDSLQEEPVSVWHNASEEPNDMSHCLIFYGCKESVGHYLHYEPVLYNKKEKVFVTSSFQHPTGYKVEQKSIDGGCVAEVYKNKRDRISISDITQWCYLKDLHNLSNVERTGKYWKEEPVSEDLLKASMEFAKGFGEWHYAMPCFQAGAEWQKKQDQSTIELAEDHAMLAGMEKMKEEMMAKAINTEASLTMSVPSICISLPLGVNVGDKVKVIVIKEDKDE